MLKLFAVRDIKAGAFGAPMALPTRALAVRVFGELVEDGRSPYAKYPADFQLYEIGDYDPNSGIITPVDVPSFLVTAFELVQVRRSEAAALQPEFPVEVK